MFTIQQIEDVIFSDNATGFCVRCGDETYGVEPDARHYPCLSCDSREVFGAEQIVIEFPELIKE